MREDLVNEEDKIQEKLKQKTWNEIRTNDSWGIFKIMSEFVDGYERLSKIGPCVSVFGSARTKPGEENYILAEEIALFIASEGVEALKNKFPKDPAIVDILSPAFAKSDRAFSDYFFEQYILALSDSSFVPLDGGQYKSPTEIRFTL